MNQYELQQHEANLYANVLQTCTGESNKIDCCLSNHCQQSLCIKYYLNTIFVILII